MASPSGRERYTRRGLLSVAAGVLLGGCTGQRREREAATPAPVPTVATAAPTPSEAAVDVVVRDPSSQGQMVRLTVQQGDAVLLDRDLTVWGPRGVRFDDVVPQSDRTDRFSVAIARDGEGIGRAAFDTTSVGTVVASVLADEVVWTTF